MRDSSDLVNSGRHLWGARRAGSAGVRSGEAWGLELAVSSLHGAVTEWAQTEPGPEGASPWDERGQSTQDLDPPAGAAHGAGGRCAGPQQGEDGEGVTWGGQARGEAPSSQTRPCRAASRRSEERRRELPRSGTAASLRGHQAGSETPGEPTAALSTPGREGRLPCRRTGYSEEGRVLGRYGATDGKSRSRTERVHRPRWSETRGR